MNSDAASALSCPESMGARGEYALVIPARWPFPALGTRTAVFRRVATDADVGPQMLWGSWFESIVARDLILGRFAARSHLNEPGLKTRERLDQITLSGHDGVDVLVRHRDFVEAR